MNLRNCLSALGLSWMAENLESELKAAALAKRPTRVLLERLFEGEREARLAGTARRRFAAARVPVVKTIADFDFNWPLGLDGDVVRHFARLCFVKEHENLAFIGGVGTGKSHMLAAFVCEACQKGLSARFAKAAEIVEQLSTARRKGKLASAMRRFTKPELLAIDELGVRSFDPAESDLLFQIFAERYERASTIVASTLAYKDWGGVFANNAAITSVILDRFTHHSHTFFIDGRSYRTKGRIEDKPAS